MPVHLKTGSSAVGYSPLFVCKLYEKQPVQTLFSGESIIFADLIF
jgi:hypothetical protein